MNRFVAASLLLWIAAGCGSSASTASPTPSANPTVAASTPAPTPAPSPTASPSPSPVLLARGNFTDRDWGPVKFEATREGSIVTGRMTIGLEEGTPSDPEQGFVTVNFHCARTTEDGLMMIGGYFTDGAGLLFRVHPEGTLAAIFLKRGSPDRASVHGGSLMNVPATQTTDCLAYLDAWLQFNRRLLGDDWITRVWDWGIEFGP